VKKTVFTDVSEILAATIIKVPDNGGSRNL
jgi:hypothetical protein